MGYFHSEVAFLSASLLGGCSTVSFAVQILTKDNGILLLSRVLFEGRHNLEGKHLYSCVWFTVFAKVNSMPVENLPIV